MQIQGLVLHSGWHCWLCAFLVLASWLLQGDLYGRVFRETIVAVIITVVRGRGNTSFAADICAT